MKKPNYNIIIPSVFVTLYIITSLVSTIHSIELFKLTNSNWLAITLAIAFEIGAAASLLAIATKNKTNQTLVWILFGLVTLVQIMGNMYHGYNHVEDFNVWSEAFWLDEMDIKDQKRIIAVVLGAILPLVALGFIKSLVDYIKIEPDVESSENLIKRGEFALERGIKSKRDIVRIQSIIENLEKSNILEQEKLADKLWDLLDENESLIEKSILVEPIEIENTVEIETHPEPTETHVEESNNKTDIHINVTNDNVQDVKEITNINETTYNKEVEIETLQQQPQPISKSGRKRDLPNNLKRNVQDELKQNVELNVNSKEDVKKIEINKGVKKIEKDIINTDVIDSDYLPPFEN